MTRPAADWTAYDTRRTTVHGHRRRVDAASHATPGTDPHRRAATVRPDRRTPMSHPLIAALKQHRNRHDLTQTEIAARSGISKTTICELESGTHSPKLSSAQAYAKALSLHVDILGGETDAAALRVVLADHRPLMLGSDHCVCGWDNAGKAKAGLTHADHVIGVWQLELSMLARR